MASRRLRQPARRQERKARSPEFWREVAGRGPPTSQGQQPGSTKAPSSQPLYLNHCYSPTLSPIATRTRQPGPFQKAPGNYQADNPAEHQRGIREGHTGERRVES